MGTIPTFPSFDHRFPELDQFLHGLVRQYKAGNIKSWETLESRVTNYFTPARMDDMESALLHWRKMASYCEGVTLVHVMCVFLGLYMLPEYENLPANQQQLMKWTILLHDIEKEVEQGKRDPTHAFRSAATAAKRLSDFGFPTTNEYPALIDSWSELASTAFVPRGESGRTIQDNSKYPEILSGIDRLYGATSPAAMIVKTVLLHLSVDVVKDWPQAAPLSDQELIRYAIPGLLPLLKVMMLSDNDGWEMFRPEERAKQRDETLEKFAQLEKMF